MIRRARRALLAPLSGLLFFAPAAQAADLVVTTPGKVFSPARVTAVPGDRVVWRNTDAFDAHTVRAGDGTFDSGRLGRMQSFARAVDRVGTVSFICTLHLNMTGAIDVVPALLEAPKDGAVGGEAVALSGRAPAGDVVIERSTDAGWVPEARVSAGADGAFSASVRPAETAAFRAVGAAGPGPAVTVRVSSRIEVGLRRTASGVVARVKPAPKGLRAVFELYSRERFAWRAVARAAVPSSGSVAFPARRGLRRTGRVVVLRADGTEVARSGRLRLWRADAPRGGAPRAGAPGSRAPGGSHDHHAGHGAPGARAAAAKFRFAVPDLLATQVRRAKAGTTVPVLLPEFIRTEHRRLHPGGRVRASGYLFDLGAARNCRRATACFVATFGAERGGRFRDGERVRLRGGRRGRYTPGRCGASCAAPQIQWRRGDVLHTIQARVGTERTERAELIAMANSAIAAGPR